MYSIALNRPRNAVLLLAVALACSLISFVVWRGLIAPPPKSEKSPTIKASTASIGTKSKSAADKPESQTGRASWYDLDSQTANGEQMDPEKMTAAHPSLPFGTQVQVENLDNGRTVTVRVNDRGPFVGERIIDVSKAAAKGLGMILDGVATVRISPQTEIK